MDNELLSAGIDIGTATTQVVFSRLIIKDKSGFWSVPKYEIASKEIIYKSDIRFTPLIGENEIDGEKTLAMIKEEYRKFGAAPENVDTGAVIITGESMRKKNASSVASLISEWAGDFVVAEAGPALESVLAGKGSGAAALSEESGAVCANFDIGGGTTNIAIFKGGEVLDASCIDIGGRLIRTAADNTVTYVAPKLSRLLRLRGMSISEGDILDDDTAQKAADIMADILVRAAGLAPFSDSERFIATDKLPDRAYTPDIFTFSGGVADCIYDQSGDMRRYGDIGCFLGRAILRSAFFSGQKTQRAAQTIRATVIGAGNFSMEISGSTIEHFDCELPIKNLPVARVRFSCDEDIPFLCERAKRAYERIGRRFALCAAGPACPSFLQIERAAEELYGFYRSLNSGEPIVIVFESDIAKAFGQALKRRIKDCGGLICIDGISCKDGDFIDIGRPAANGRVLPVIVKTLIFS